MMHISDHFTFRPFYFQLPQKPKQLGKINRQNTETRQIGRTNRQNRRKSGGCTHKGIKRGGMSRRRGVGDTPAPEFRLISFVSNLPAPWCSTKIPWPSPSQMALPVTSGLPPSSTQIPGPLFCRMKFWTNVPMPPADTRTPHPGPERGSNADMRGRDDPNDTYQAAALGKT